MKSKSLFEVKVEDIFAKDGPFAKLVSSYRERDSQIKLSLSIEEAINKQQKYIAEAGTGTGKTFAYLVPALLSDKKVIISTGTKNLQDQLFNQDLPLVLKALGSGKKVSLLKGRANYLCHYRIALHEAEGGFASREIVSDFMHILQELPKSKTGDISHLTKVEEFSQVWPYVTSTAENCLGSECDYYKDCFLVKARKKAQIADLLVINHHLYFADLMLKEEGFGDILPGAELIVFDEAHQLPDVALNFFGEHLTSRQLIELTKDTRLESLTVGSDMEQLIRLSEALEKTILDLRLAFGSNLSRQTWLEVYASFSVKKTMELLVEIFEEFCDALKIASERSEGLLNCLERCFLFKKMFEYLLNPDDCEKILWVEIFKRAFVFHASPKDVSQEFKAAIAKHQSNYIFTSATLAIDGDFQHFIDLLGLENTHCGLFESPFNYLEQSLLYFPRYLPEVKSHDYIDRLIDNTLPIIKSIGGRTFYLFTSYKAISEAYDYLHTKVDFPLLIQGTKSKQQLLDEFKELGNAILIGTSSFWEGVDVRGELLSCVIIDKLPFASPADPIMKSKIAYMRTQGLDPFNQYQLPKAVIALKQGVGRLIRDEHDKGVIVIADPRLTARAYGKKFLASLPLMRKTRELDKVLQFIDDFNMNS